VNQKRIGPIGSLKRQKNRSVRQTLAGTPGPGTFLDEVSITEFRLLLSYYVVQSLTAVPENLGGTKNSNFFFFERLFGSEITCGPGQQQFQHVPLCD
jgi:hypothetical protein